MEYIAHLKNTQKDIISFKSITGYNYSDNITFIVDSGSPSSLAKSHLFGLVT